MLNFISKNHNQSSIISMSFYELSLGQFSTIHRPQDQDSFTVHEFVNEIMNLSRTSILYHCPHTQERLIQIYFMICQHMNTQKMDKSDVMKFIQAQRNENQKIITQQVNYYKQNLQKKLQENIPILSKLQFQKMLNKVNQNFSGDKNSSTIITDILLQKSKSSEFFSCIKVLEVLREISKEVDEYIEPSLSPEKLIQDRRISEQPKALIEQPSMFFEQVGMMLRNDPRQKIKRDFTQFKNKVQLLTEFIPDDKVREQAENLIEKLTIHQGYIQDKVELLIQMNQQSEKNYKQLYQAFQRAKLEQLIFEDANEDYKNRISELNGIISQIQRQYKQKLQKMVHMQSQIEIVVEQLSKMKKQCGEMETQLKDERKKYEELYKEYQKIVETKNIKSVSIQKKPVIFQERTLKQKLDDAEHRLKRFQAQNQKTAEKIQQKDNTIQLLQAKVAELSAQVQTNNKKTEDLRQYRQPSRIFNSILSRRDSHVSNRNADSIVMGGSWLRKSKIIRDSIIQQANSRINPNRRTSFFLENDQPNKVTNLSRIKNIDIAAGDLPQIQEQNTNPFEVSGLSSAQQQITQVIKKDNNSIAQEVQDKDFLKKSTAIKVQHAQRIVPNKLQDQNLSSNFMSKGVLINVLGVKYEITLLLTHKRFCYFDMKLRLVRYLPIQNIKSFVFCKQNLTLFIIRPKNTSSLDPKTYIVNPMIFSIRNRDRLAQYLTTKASKFIKQNQIELLTKLQDDIFLSIDNKEINLKHKIPKMNNPYRLALSDQPVFYAKLQQEGLLTFKDNAIIVIQPMGLVCFKGEETYQLEQKQQLLYYLPFNNCIMSQRENSREAPGRKLKLIYQTQQQKYFNLVFTTNEELKLFLVRCKQQQSKNKNYRIILNQNLDIMFKK